MLYLQCQKTNKYVELLKLKTMKARETRLQLWVSNHEYVTYYYNEEDEGYVVVLVNNELDSAQKITKRYYKQQAIIEVYKYAEKRKKALKTRI